MTKPIRNQQQHQGSKIDTTNCGRNVRLVGNQTAAKNVCVQPANHSTPVVRYLELTNYALPRLCQEPRACTKGSFLEVWSKAWSESPEPFLASAKNPELVPKALSLKSGVKLGQNPQSPSSPLPRTQRLYQRLPYPPLPRTRRLYQRLFP